MKYAAPFILLLLTACGAEAPPRAAEPVGTGLTVSGEIRMGVKTEL